MRDCRVVTMGSALFGIVPGYPTEEIVLSEEEPIGWQTCRRISDGAVTGGLVLWNPPQVTAGVVAEARSRLQLALPEVATSPPRGAAQLVGIPVWFWADRSEPVTTTAEVPGLSATLVATPTHTRFAVSGGAGRAEADNVVIDCPDGGTPWEPDRYEPWAASDCSHAFEWNATYTVDATVTWSLAWTASNGESGTLPDVDRTSTFTLAIEEGQAVTD